MFIIIAFMTNNAVMISISYQANMNSAILYGKDKKSPQLAVPTKSVHVQYDVLIQYMKVSTSIH